MIIRPCNDMMQLLQIFRLTLASEIVAASLCSERVAVAKEFGAA